MSKTYIMHPNLYYNLCNVRGFCDLNGNTYNEYVYITLDNKIDDTIRHNIVNAINEDAVLDVLKNNNINYTHDYEEALNNQRS